MRHIRGQPVGGLRSSAESWGFEPGFSGIFGIRNLEFPLRVAATFNAKRLLTQSDTMNTDPVYQRLLEISWRRPLTAPEQAELDAWLAAHPEVAADQSLEEALNAAFARLPQAPVSSNFTARVLEAIEHEEAASGHQRWSPGWLWRVLVPRIAVAMVVVGSAGSYGYHHHLVSQREGIAKSITVIAGVPALPAPEILADFDVIQKLNTSAGASEAGADKELLALMQ